MKRIAIYYLLSVFLYSCNLKEENPNKVEDKQSVQENSISFLKKDFSKEELLTLYSNSNYSDTVICYEIYKSTKSSVLQPYYAAYKSYDIERDKYDKIFNELFILESDIDSLKAIISKNISDVRQWEREYVLEIYEEYNSLEGEDFSYLCQVQDSFAYNLAIKYSENKKINSNELRRVAYEILKHYNDSILIKKFQHHN